MDMLEDKARSRQLTVYPNELESCLLAILHELKQLAPLIVAHRREAIKGLGHWFGLSPAD